MLYGTHNAKLDALFLTRYTCQEATLMVVADRATQRVAHLVAEGAYAVEFLSISLHRQFLCGISTRAGAPSLTIDIY